MPALTRAVCRAMRSAARLRGQTYPDPDAPSKANAETARGFVRSSSNTALLFPTFDKALDA
jgi:hypothetical protein